MFKFSSNTISRSVHFLSCVCFCGEEREREREIYIDRKKEKGTKERVSKGEKDR
jgi:hypothetical protein